MYSFILIFQGSDLVPEEVVVSCQIPILKDLAGTYRFSPGAF